MKIYSEAPTRLGLFGGGTDVDPYASEYGGVCINLAIDLRQKILITNEHNQWSIPTGANSGFYTNIFNEMGYHTIHGMEAEFDAVIESGLGSSASAAVTLIGAILKAQGKDWTQDEIAERAWHIEVNKLGLFGGKQDQYAAVYGGLNQFKFTKEGVTQHSFPRSIAEELSQHILLFYSGSNRKNTKIQENLKTINESQIGALDSIKDITHEAYRRLYSRNYEGLGRLLKISWEEKKKSNPKATNERLDTIHKTLDESGAWGSKTSGSGGGGFCFCLAPKKKHGAIIDKMESIGCVHYDFNPDFNGLMVRKLP